MGANSAIEWTHHTFNSWRGCTKLSQGCKHCYALTMSGRNPAVLGIWGPKGTRPIAAESYWRQPLKWNRDAEQASERRRVFCASLADVFEGEDTMPREAWYPVQQARARLYQLIEDTPWLDWLLLTKRPEWIERLQAEDWRKRWPDNVWIGTSIEDQATADERIPHLLRVPAKVRFLSCEPLLGPVTLFDTSEGVLRGPAVIISGGRTPSTPDEPSERYDDSYPGIDWVICGGESGAQARPMNPEWARALRNQCQAAGVAYHFKQWGEWEPYEEDAQPPFWRDTKGKLYDGHGLDILDPETGGMGRGWHEDSLYGGAAYRRVGKKAAGRLLDGRTWDEFPR